MATIALHILTTFNPDNFFQDVDYRVEKTKLELKMGIAVGPLVTGICGSKKFLWDIWGDTCNMASRMQTTLIGSGIQVTEAVYERLKDKFVFSDKMSTIIKGKGKTPTYLLLDVKNENAPNGKRRSLIKNMVENNIQQESSKSSISSNFNKFFIENTNKCMADDIIIANNISKMNVNDDDNNVHGLTYEILNDSDFEDDNNSLSNSSINIFGLEMGNRSLSCQNKNDNSIQNHINNEIALNINQRIQNVLTNYDQIQNLKNITNNSVTSIHENNPRITSFLEEDSNSDSEVEGDIVIDEEKPSLIKGILNRTKSYQFSKRAPSTRAKRNGEYEGELVSSVSHKNFTSYNMKSNESKNRSYTSEDLISNYTDDRNYSVDCISEYDMVSNKLTKTDKKKRKMFKSFHSFKQKSENNLSRKGVIVNADNGNVSLNTLNTYKSNKNSNKSCCISVSGIGNYDDGNKNFSNINILPSNLSLSNYRSQMVLDGDADSKCYSSIDIKNTTKSNNKLAESSDKKENTSYDSGNLASPIFFSKFGDASNDTSGNTKGIVSPNHNAAESFDQMSFRDNNTKLDSMKDSSNSMSSSADDTSPRKISRFSKTTNHTASMIIKKRISFMSDSTSVKDKLTSSDTDKINELKSFDTTNSITNKNNSHRTSITKLNENTIPIPINENDNESEIETIHNKKDNSIDNAKIIDNMSINNDNGSIMRTAVIDNNEYSPYIPSNTDTTTNQDILKLKNNNNNDYIINISPNTFPPPIKKSTSKSLIIKSKHISPNFGKSTRISNKKSIYNTNTQKDQEITGIIDTISKELEKIEDEEYYHTIAKTTMCRFTHIFKEPSLEKVYQNAIKKQFSPLSLMKKIITYPIFIFFTLFPVCFNFYDFNYDHSIHFNFINGEKEIIKSNFSALDNIIKKPLFIILVSLFLFSSLLLIIDAFFFTYNSKINNTLRVLNIVWIYGISVYLIFYRFHIESYFIFIVLLVNIFYKLPFIIHSILAISYIVIICICTFIKNDMRVFIKLIMIAIPFSILLIFFLSGKEMQNRVKFVLRKTVIHQHNTAKNEDKKSLQLLYNCLPEFVVHELCKENLSSWRARRFDGVTIFCMDVVNFTKLSSNLSPQDVIALLNEIFSEFDNLCTNGIEKYQTIGDAYQAGAGCPYPCSDHAIKMINFSKEVLKVTKKFNEQHDIDIIMSKNNNLAPNINLMKKDISEPYNIRASLNTHDHHTFGSYESYSNVNNSNNSNISNVHPHKKGSFLLFNENILKHKMHGVDNINTNLRGSQSFSHPNSPFVPFSPFESKAFTNFNNHNLDTNKIKNVNSNSNIIKLFPHIDIRIGVYSGYVFAGVIGGQKRFKFEVFGDAIDKATLLESHGVVNRIHVSQSVYEQTCMDVKYELLEKTIKEIGFNGYLVVDEDNN
ncbi:hypothetical protein BCR36DRAFT_332100 [Piromyces finnis]|uniref:Guanylate cyclase domain-containing protein n=1 Tax=Piromyces finnis TaxID=1754191 RepID=A0A1Y1V316_9FUNG|nr:hypothetical protein BCR36DRAFT_332100 [Piromyces finnis]|eukprot:ORX46172.1 hypothetical protein BCR36DRAFT_332100 [Piromyces finnis]